MSINRPKRRLVLRAGVPLVATGLLVLAGAGVASAHVTAHSPDVPARGGYANIVFRAPNEQPAATFGKLEVDFPAGTPLGAASVLPLPGWNYQVNMVHLAKPVKMTKETITDAVGSIVWTAQPGAEIKPGEFEEFTISAEGLPTNTGTLVMPAVQTYSNGVVVHWDENIVAGKPEPEHPAPVLTLAPAGATGTSAAGAAAPTTTGTDSGDEDTALWLGGIGVLLGALALGFSLGALVRSRREPRPPVIDEPDEADDDTDPADTPAGKGASV
jgi:uncharacterized protein YcnI